MSPLDIILIAAIAVWFFLAVRASRKGCGGCCGDCKKCRKGMKKYEK